jgi:hypothetical protein
MLFIDDKEANVRASEQAGFPGHIFTTAGGVEAELERRGISLPPLNSDVSSKAVQQLQGTVTDAPADASVRRYVAGKEPFPKTLTGVASTPAVSPRKARDGKVSRSRSELRDLKPEVRSDAPFRSVRTAEVRADRMARSMRKNTQPATVFVDAEDFPALSKEQKKEYLLVALSNKELRMVVYNERGQGRDQDKVLSALFKLNNVTRTDLALPFAERRFGRPNAPSIHLSKQILPSRELVQRLKKKVSFFKTNGNKGGTLATALLWAISGGEAVRFAGVKEEDGFWTVEETLLNALQRTYDNNFVIAIAA